ncbi:hypothetical protein VTN77DRAFT_6997 [Rasamsonia byssochlamydoides]|uniref:uncharacterized protein n=1 Tax=Rasamsonia byssochlamydoides TaxID=89139 RepID=UPI0037442E81
MPDQPVQSQAMINRANSNASERPLSVASSKSSTMSGHRRFFSLGSFEDNSSTSSLKNKFFRSRSKSPVPQSSNASNAPTSSNHLRRSASPPSYIPTPLRSASPTATSHPSSPVSASRPAAGKRSSRNDYKRYSGTLNHYGRHSNDWLFGGFSVRDAVRDGLDRLLNHDDKEG